jgi:ABC-2 type transport system ATP-binding protein/lipopolysaccharide transport system ATP-binding protein
MTVAIVASGLGKRYRLGQGVYGYSTLRETLVRKVRAAGSGSDAARREIWALRDIDLEIGEGDVVGIIGRNGAGKTTLLKTVARIVRPTTGLVRVRGRVGALLEVGTGFHPELTGRENVYLNGVILGMTRREVRQKFDEIVEFAGVERFLDTPLKRYSSGMYLRLAFSVAAHIDPDVIIVDEVLAVGDAEFRKRCLGRMSEFGSEGRTVLFVSHDTGAVGQLCERAIWLERGRVRDDGAAQGVLDGYLRDVATGAATVAIETSESAPVSNVAVSVIGADGAEKSTLRRDEPITFRVRLGVDERVPQLDVGLYIVNRRGVRVLNEDASASGVEVGGPSGSYEVRVTVPPVLPADDFVVGVWVGTANETFADGEVLTLSVLPLPTDRQDTTHGVVRPPVSWTVEKVG